MASTKLSILFFVAAALTLASCDPEPLQDFCIADLDSKITVNGFPCKNDSLASVDDFVFSGLAKMTNTSQFPFGVGSSAAKASTFPALNTQGLTVARIDYAKGGIVSPHTHNRATEIIYVLKGSLYSGFVTNDNRLFAKVIHAGDLMIFPKGLLHWQMNVGNSVATGIVVLNSQDPGSQLMAYALLGTNIPNEVLQKTFFVNESTVELLKSSLVF